MRIHSANSHGEFGEFARRRGTATAPPTANVFGTLRASAAGRCTLFRALYAWHGEFAVRIRMACRRRGAEAPPTAIHRPLPTAPPTANGRASLRLAAGRNYSCGHIATLPRAMAWCAGNQCCCRHGGRRDGQWRRRGGGSTRRAPSATWLSRRLLYNLG